MSTIQTTSIHDAYRERSVLITGGLGFIGSNLARRLVEVGDVEIYSLDALVPDQGGNLFNIEDIKDQVTLHVADMCDPSVINHLVGGMDYVFNLSSNVRHLDSLW